MNFTKLTGRKPRRHVIIDGRPLCGGGNGGKTTHWQQDMGEVNCARCQAITANRTPPRHRT